MRFWHMLLSQCSQMGFGCGQTPSSNQRLQTQRGNSTPSFCDRRSREQRMHIQYPCVVWNLSGWNSIPFPRVACNLPYSSLGGEKIVCAFQYSNGSPDARLRAVSTCWKHHENLPCKFKNSDATWNWKFVTSTWISPHPESWSFQTLWAFRSFNWGNICRNSSTDKW
jgi:hypothetical protein